MTTNLAHLFSRLLAADAAADAARDAHLRAAAVRSAAYDALVIALAQGDQRAIDAQRRALDAADQRLDDATTARLAADDAAEAARATHASALDAALDAALATLRALDANGAATLTDGTLDQYDVEERLAIVEAAIAAVRANA